MSTAYLIIKVVLLQLCSSVVHRGHCLGRKICFCACLFFIVLNCILEDKDLENHRLYPIIVCCPAYNKAFKGLVHQKINVFWSSSFSNVNSKLYDFLPWKRKGYVLLIKKRHARLGIIITPT